MSFFKRNLLIVIACCMLFSSHVDAVTLKGEDKKIADTIINRIITSKAKYDFIPLADPAKVSNEGRIIAYVDEKCGKYFRISACNYSQEWVNDRWFDGFVIYTKDAKAIYKYNDMLVKKAKKIVKKYTKKKMSKKKKARALAKGVARCLSYKYFDDSHLETSISNNLKKNKGACFTYAQMYQACCDLAKIKCEHVIGYADEGYHSWNRVKIGKKWRYVDVTWYDCTKNGKYILKSKLWKSHRISRIVKVYRLSW